jgi:hypothetical protein
MAAIVALVLVPVLSSPAAAYHSRHTRHHFSGHHKHFYLSRYRSDECELTNSGRRVCNANYQPRVLGANANYQAPVLDAAGNRAFAMIDAETIIGSRPSGCPHSYCGCGLRKYLGLNDTRLNLAANWARLLPRESGPRAGLAAVRNHHVMYIEAAAGNGQWLIRDYNSGGGLSRMHVRDVRGYIFVNPRA